MWTTTAAASALAEISEIELTVDGLACPFCVHGIRKKVGEVRGVKSVEVGLKDGVVSIVPSTAALPDPEALRDAIRRAGFTAGELRITAIGALSLADDGVRLNVRRTDQVYFLLEQTVGAPLSPGQKLHERLVELENTNTTVKVTGVVRSAGGTPPGLFVDALEPLDE